MNTTYHIVKEQDVPNYVLRRIKYALEHSLPPIVSILDEGNKLIFREYSYEPKTKQYMMRKV